MSKRRIAGQSHRLLREADRGRAKGLAVADICRKRGIAGATCHRSTPWAALLGSFSPPLLV